MLLPPKNGGISMTFTNAFYIETIFEIAFRYFDFGSLFKRILRKDCLRSSNVPVANKST